MPYVTVEDGVEIFYRDVGEGPVVVLLHGACMDHRVWERQETALLDAGFRIVSPDLRGHGRSDKPKSDYSASMYADDVSTLVQTLDIERFTLVGWSLGATVAAHYTADDARRLSHLALVSSELFRGLKNASSNESSVSGVSELKSRLRRNYPEGMAEYVTRMFGLDTEDWTVQLLWNIGMQTPLRVALRTLEIYADPDYHSLRSTLADVDVPGAVFHGAHDGTATLTEAKHVATEVLSDGRFSAFEASGHIPFIEESDTFNEELTEFLQSE